MTEKPKRVAIIGLDCAQPQLIAQHIAEGYLPTFKKLFEGGAIAENGLVPFPTITPPNWATIATGTWPGTHGITDFSVPIPGASPIDRNTVEAFHSDRCQAETLWDALDKIGKKCIVMNYPGAWPSKMKNGIMVGGTGLGFGEYRDGYWGLTSRHHLCHDQLVTTGIYPLAIRGTFVEATGWTNVPEMGEEPLEMAVKLQFNDALDEPAETIWYALVRQTGEDDEYDQVTLSPTKNMDDAFCTLGLGEWSAKIVTTIQMKDGSAREVFFRCKLLELSDDAEDFRLFISAMGDKTGMSSPPEIADDIVSEEGGFAPAAGLRGYPLGWFDLDTYVEINHQYSQYMADAAAALLSKNDWDLFIMHSHPIDWVYHAIMKDMDPATSPDAATRQKNWEAHLKVHEGEDRMLARVLSYCDEDTLVVLVSDHGATPDGPMFNPYDALVPAGLCSQPEPMDMSDQPGFRTKFLGANALIPDVSKSKALPQRSIYIYVNLKGRDPGGIVDPEDYEKVQRDVIDALYAYVDPRKGKRPVALALTKQDARILGLYGDNIGDVIYAIYPEFGSQHGNILPAAEYGLGSIKTLLAFIGPGIKKGFHIQRNTWITDMVPTVCYLMDWPTPEQTEGAVLYQIFEDPDFKRKAIEELKSKLANLESQLA